MNQMLSIIHEAFFIYWLGKQIKAAYLIEYILKQKVIYLSYNDVSGAQRFIICIFFSNVINIANEYNSENKCPILLFY